MNRWDIQKVEGGFIVEIYVPLDDPPPNMMASKTTRKVFTDSSSLLNFLHNEFVGSN